MNALFDAIPIIAPRAAVLSEGILAQPRSPIGLANDFDDEKRRIGPRDLQEADGRVALPLRCSKKDLERDQ